MYLKNIEKDDYVEGEIYEVVEIEGHRFEIVCGYNGKQDKKAGIALPMYPNFKKTPKYTKEGYQLATCLQDGCKYYEPIPDGDNEKDCIDCKYFESKNRSVIGICKCEKRRKTK